MHDHGIGGEQDENRLSEAQRDNGVLNLMFCDSPYPWTINEIAREIQDYGDAVDSVRRLAECGLLHRAGDFVFPTRTARRAEELQVGTV